MAENSMGQYRYSGSGLMSKINTTKSYKSAAISTGSSTNSSSFKDVQISPASGVFTQNQDYHCKITIPQDMNYTINFDIQLIKAGTSADSTYQFIKGVTLERGGSGSNVYHVVLYENLDKKIVAAIPETYIAGKTNTRNTLYYQSSTGKYFLGNGGTTYTACSNFNSLNAVASWVQESGENFGVFEFTFRPVDSGFTHLLLRMVRSAEDYNIQRVQTDGTVEYGRKIDLNKVTCELHSLVDLVPRLSPYGTLSRIGVWAHPGFIMMINGEEIKVTANGYYELDALPITSLSMVAADNDYNSFFTIDYEYEVAEG